MGDDIETTPQSSEVIAHDQLTRSLRVRHSCVDCADCSSDSDAGESADYASKARLSSIAPSSTEQHAHVSASHRKAEAACQEGISPSSLANGLASEMQPSCTAPQPASSQHVPADTGRAWPAQGTAAVRRRLFGLQQGVCSAEGGSFSCATGEASGRVETPRERAERICLGFCAPRMWAAPLQECNSMQPSAAPTAQTAAAPPEQAGLRRKQEALVGRLIAEAEEAECTAADMREQLQQLQGAKSTLEGKLQKERMDRWCLDVAKSGLQERVATQAAACVELGGLTEKLSLQCSDKAQTIQELKARVRAVQALLDASEAETQKLAEAHLARVQRLEQDLLLSCKDRWVREALEYAISVIRGSEERAHEGESPRMGLRRSPSGGCWPATFSRRSGSRSSSRDNQAAGQPMGSPPAQQEGQLPSTLVAPRVSSFTMPATPGRTEGSFTRHCVDEQAESCTSSLTASPMPLKLTRGDSATTVPAKRRAMSNAALTHAQLNGASHEDFDPSAFSHSQVGSPSCAEGLVSNQHAPPGSVRKSRSLTSPHQRSIPGRLGFAHSVTPHISNIGRQLAVQCAVNFESCRLRAPSQELASHDLELRCSPRQEMD